MNKKDENKAIKINGLLGRLKIQSERIIDVVKKNEDEMCALIVIGTMDRTVSLIHSKGANKIALAMANMIYNQPGMVDVIEAAMGAAVEAAKEHLMSNGEQSDEDGDER